MIKYVVGFVFSPSKDKVLLIRKNRPDFQMNKLNGIGGKVEQDETYLQAIIRETYEESGLVINDWTNFAILNHVNYCIYFYMTISGDYFKYENKTDEEIEMHTVSELLTRDDLMNHIRWLVPLSITTDIQFPIQYSDIGENQMLIKLINNDEEFEWFYNKSMTEIELDMENREKSDIMCWLMKNTKDLVLIHDKSLLPIKPTVGVPPLPTHNITLTAPNANSMMPAGTMSFNTNTGQMMVSNGTMWFPRQVVVLIYLNIFILKIPMKQCCLN